MFNPSTPFGSSSFGSSASAFGSTPATFGSTGFQATSGLFGQKTTGMTTFGAVTPSQSGTSLFGKTTSGGTPSLFGSTTSNTFGSGANAQKTSGFGTFGTSGTTGGLFGGGGTTGSSMFSGSTSAFGNGNTSMFGASTNASGSLFGTTTTNTGTSLFGGKPAQTSGSMFGSSTTGSLFGSTAQAGQTAAGTPAKFVPQTSSDTMMKSGITQQINTKHQCITLMKEYDKKSLEELRMEDYQLGRKGPQASGGTTAGTGLFQSGGAFGTSTGAGSTFGSGAFGTSSGTSLFGQTTQAPSMFGAKTTSSGLFGSTSTSFSAPSAFTNTSGSLFGKPGGLFNPTTTTQSAGLFGGTSGFGTASSGTSLFGTPPFGQTTAQAGMFGATSQPSTGLFGKTAFGASGTGLFGNSAFGQTTQPSLFGAKTSTGTLGTFGTTNTGSLFGTQNKPAFGATFGTGTGGTSLFGNPTGTGLFGNPTGGLAFGKPGATLGQPFGSTAFGQTALGGAGTGMLGLGQNNAAALQQQQQIQQQLQQQVLALTSSPFGDSPLFRNLTSRTKTDKPLAVTSQARHKGANTPSQYKVSPRPSARVKPRAIGKLNFSQARLFDGLDDDIEYSSETFVPRRSIKKLVLNSKSQTRSISSELSDTPHASNGDGERSPEASQVQPASKSNGELTRSTFYSPKPNTSFGKDDQDSPLVGVRRSNVPRDEEDTGRQRINGSDDVSTSQSEPLTALGNEDRDSDDEQGPEPREGDTLEDETQRNVAQAGGCGVILERAEYFCNPSIAELDDMVDGNGDVIVGDFVVGREGFGMVKFFGECNVAGLNLDEIVIFRRREIEVYPDTFPDKPPVGEGLNRRSEVTLYKVWPNDKTTRTPIKNPDRLRKVGWLEKLENATARLGATFVDYQADTGTWIFTVEHFTRYGLKEVHIEMEDGSVTRPPLPSFHEDKEKLLEKARFEKEKAAMAVKMRLEEDMKNKKKLMQETIRDDTPSFLDGQDDSQMTDISQESFPEFQEQFEEENTTSPASHHLATAMGVKSHRMQVMKASFFAQSEEPQRRYINNNDMRPREFRLGTRSVLHSTGFDEFDGKSMHERPIYSPVKTKSMTIYPESPSRDDTRGAKERRIEYENYRNKPQWYSLPQPILLPSAVGSPSETALKAAGIRTQPALVPLSQSVTAGKHNLFADAGLTMGRSFRVGWGPAWTLVYSSRVMSVSPNPTEQRLGREIVRGSPLVASTVKNQHSSSFAISCARLNVSPTMKWNSDVSQTQLIERLEVCLANITRDEDSSPYFSPAEGVTALHQYAEVGAKSKEMLASGAFKESADIFSSVMDLAIALWGNLSISKDSMDTDHEDVAIEGYDEALARTEALSNWLAKTSRSAINEEMENIKATDNDHLRIIFSLLTGKQINAACQVAQSNGDSRLSLLLAQSSGNMILRQWLLKQLDDWLEHKVDRFITVDRLKIYALLAGELSWRGLQVCEDLDWKRTFALHLWYQRSSSGLLPDALASYENSFKSRTSTGIYATDPSPSYLAGTQEARTDSECEDEAEPNACRDTCYHLLKLFCKRSHRLESTLAPASYTRYQLDVSLSWHLYQILRSVGYNHLSDYYASYLNTSYAGQLEAVGLWHWAIFVLMHIQDPERRGQAIQKVLVRYCTLDDDPDYSEKETFLLNDLGVPGEWIHEAKVIRARMEKRPKDEAYHLLKSGNYNLGHEVILSRLASLAIINEEYDSIKELLVEIAPRENSSQVSNWNTGGQIYLDYIKLWEKFSDIKNGVLVPNAYQLEKMQTKVSSLCHRISQLPSTTATDRLCQSDMGTMCANFLKIIAKELAIQSDESETYHTQSSVLAPHIEKLPLPEDCCLTELRELTSSYIDELAQV